jgi:S-adenosylmethionine:tRNA ribosyltransferase-isomerase
MSEIFNFKLPKELIAQYPLKEREKARLMVVFKDKGEIAEDVFENIDKYLKKGNILVLNNTKVIPARLNCKKETGGKIEILLLKNIDDYNWKVLAKGKVKEKVKFYKEGLEGEILNRNEDGSFTVRFNKDKKEIKKYGEVPLPPYIKRKPEEIDKTYYQTVYASKNGSIAAPTAGLHFTEEILEKLEKNGIEILFITLHMGWSSIKILKDAEKSVGEEYCEVNEDVCEKINNGKKEGRRIIAVGTGTTRAIESAWKNDRIYPFSGYTGLFIKPGFKFNVIDGLITNFHLPNSTHLLLVYAFCGEILEKAYNLAIEKKYRFYSYGDCMLII